MAKQENANCPVVFGFLDTECKDSPYCLVLENDRGQGKTPENLEQFVRNLPQYALELYIKTFDPDEYIGDCAIHAKIHAMAVKVWGEKFSSGS